jgi:hypothetical protein
VLRDEVARLNTLIDDLTLLSSAEEIATHLAIEDVDLLSEIYLTDFTGCTERGWMAAQMQA